MMTFRGGAVGASYDDFPVRPRPVWSRVSNTCLARPDIHECRSRVVTGLPTETMPEVTVKSTRIITREKVPRLK